MALIGRRLWPARSRRRVFGRTARPEGRRTPMRRLALALALLLPLTACPEQRPPAGAPAAAAAGRARRRRRGGGRAHGGAPRRAGVVRPLPRRQEGGLVARRAAPRDPRRPRRPRRRAGRRSSARRWAAARSSAARRRSGSTRRGPAGGSSPSAPAWAGDGGARTVQGTCERRDLQGRPRGRRRPRGADRSRACATPRTSPTACGSRRRAARRVSGGQLDLEKLRVREVQDVFLRRERIAGAGVQEEVSVVAESEAGDRMAAEYKVADDGRIVEIRLGEAIVARPEPEDAAKRLDTIDLFALARVALPAPLPRDGPEDHRLPALRGSPPPSRRTTRASGSSGRRAGRRCSPSRPAARPPPTRRRTRRSRRRPPAPPPTTSPRRRRRTPTTPEIRRLAAARWWATRRGTYEAARRLSDHVYRTPREGLRREPRPRERRARGGQGRLHRARRCSSWRSRAPPGIPARGVHGLVYAQLRRRPARALLARLGGGAQRGRVDRHRPHLRPAGRRRDARGARRAGRRWTPSASSAR